MADLVIDSSVIVKWYLPDALAAESHRIQAAYQGGTLTLRAPDLMYADIGNIAWKKHMIQGLASSEAKRVIAAFRAVLISITPAADLLEDAYDLAATHRCTVYDALYLALSVRKGCPFVTADERLVNTVAGALPQVVWLSQWTPPPPPPTTGPGGQTP